MTQIRRVVTGHNQEGEAIIVSDGAPPSVFDNLGQPGLVFHELWRTHEAPVIVGNCAKSLKPDTRFHGKRTAIFIESGHLFS